MGSPLVQPLGSSTAGRLSLSPVTWNPSQSVPKHMNTSLQLSLETVWRCVHSKDNAGVIASVQGGLQ